MLWVRVPTALSRTHPCHPSRVCVVTWRPTASGAQRSRRAVAADPLLRHGVGAVQAPRALLPQARLGSGSVGRTSVAGADAEAAAGGRGNGSEAAGHQASAGGGTSAACAEGDGHATYHGPVAASLRAPTAPCGRDAWERRCHRCWRWCCDAGRTAWCPCRRPGCQAGTRTSTERQRHGTEAQRYVACSRRWSIRANRTSCRQPAHVRHGRATACCWCEQRRGRGHCTARCDTAISQRAAE